MQVKPTVVTPDPALLLEMAEAVQKGAFSIPLGEKFSLADAGKAHAAYQPSRLDGRRISAAGENGKIKTNKQLTIAH